MRQIRTTQSMCFDCGKPIPAVLYEEDGKVFMDRVCDSHGRRTGLISNDAAWYHRAMSFSSVPTALKAPATSHVHGCPLDCGFCSEHRQRMYLPVVSITSACNLDCPVCYTINRSQEPYFMSKEEFARILEVIHRHDPNMQIINFTGGEPTLHPEFADLVQMCQRAGIHRITVSTNGLRLREDPELLARLADLEARIVLSFNSFRPVPYHVSAGRDLLDRKLEVLELLKERGVSTTLLSVAMAGVNDEEIGHIVRYVLESDFIVSSQIHTVTYTGQARDVFDRSTRLTTPDVIASITKANPDIVADDFMPSPCAHPLCYSQCYVLKLEDGQAVPLRQFLSEERMWRLLEGSFYMEPTIETEEILNDAVNDLWGRAEPSTLDRKVLTALRNLLCALYPHSPISYRERQRIAEQRIRTIYISSHMDDENFDLERAAACCVSVPEADGRLIPTCSYNNLYRQRDSRFSSPH
jgi:hypothetical protein